MNMSVENKSCSRHIKRHLAYLLEFLLARLKGLGIQIATNTTLADHWHTFKSLNWINVFTIPVSIYSKVYCITWFSKVEICLTKSGVAPVVHTRNYQSLIPESCILSHHSLTVSHRQDAVRLDAFKTQLRAEQGWVSSSVHCTLTRTGYHCHQPGLPDLSHMSGVNDSQSEGRMGSRRPIRGWELHILCIPETQTPHQIPTLASSRSRPYLHPQSQD